MKTGTTGPVLEQGIPGSLVSTFALEMEGNNVDTGFHFHPTFLSWPPLAISVAIAAPEEAPNIVPRARGDKEKWPWDPV